MEKKFEQKGVATFEGFAIGKNQIVTFKLKLRYDEVITSVNLLQGLNADITVLAKIPNAKVVSLGVFTVGGITFDRDGNAKVTLKSLVSSVNLDNICDIVEEEYVQIKFMAVLELEDKG